MNQADKLGPDPIIKREKKFREIVRANFRAARSSRTQEPIFKRCIMVENPDGTKWVDAVLVDLATSLRDKS
jgi:hypothetical protein